MRNRGDAHFEDVTEEAGILSFHPGLSAAWGDFDNDGWVDLFFGNESRSWDRNPSQLFRNLGDGRFVEVAERVGIRAEGLVKGAVWGDYDNDGWIDLYLSRFAGDNLLYHNEGVHNEGPSGDSLPRFREVGREAGVTEPKTSFATWFFDYDQDGWLDLFAAGYGASFLELGPASVAAEMLGRPARAETPRLYRNLGNGRFEERTVPTGLARVSHAMGANYGDLDNDGYPDLYLGTGAPSFSAVIPNRMFKNAGGERFHEVTYSGGFGHLQKGHGISFADLDNDGDQDIYAVMGGAFTSDTYPNVLFLNPGSENAWITLRLEGVQANRAAIGARIRVRVEGPGGQRSVYALAGTGGSFGSSSLQQEMGLGNATALSAVEITWPGETEPESFGAVPLRGIYHARQGSGVLTPVPLERLALGSGNAAGAASEGHKHGHEHQHKHRAPPTPIPPR